MAITPSPTARATESTPGLLLGPRTTPMTIYVSSSGSDSNDGSAAHPLLTIQAAVDKIDVVSVPTTINVGAGTFAGFRIDSKRIAHPASTAAGAYIAVLGAIGTYTPATGPSTVTIGATTVLSDNNSQSSFQVVGAGWTVDDLKGKFLHNNTLNNLTYIPIVGNTSDTIYYYGTNATVLVTGQSVSIVEPKTVINSLAANAQTLSDLDTYTDHHSGTELNALAKVYNMARNGGYGNVKGSVLLMGLQFTANTNGWRRVSIQNSAVIMRCVKTDGTSASTHIETNDSNLTLSGYISQGSGVAIIDPSSQGGYGRIGINWGYIEKSSGTGISGCHLLSLNQVMFKGCTIGLALSGGNASMNNVSFYSCGTGVSANLAAAYSSFLPATLSGNGMYFESVGTCIDLRGPHFGNIKYATIATGCTTGIKCLFGARLGIRTDFGYTIAPTTEIQLDTTTSTLAAMRAASPNAVVDSTFRSMVFTSDFT